MHRLNELFKRLGYSVKQLKRADTNILNYIVYALLYDVVINMYKPFALKFLERVGGTEFHISLYNSLPAFVAIFALIPGSAFIAGFNKKKKVTAVFFAISRLMIPVLALVPLLDEALRPIAFVLIIGMMNFPDAISQTALQSFLGENFDGRIRATAISLRTKFGQVVTLGITLITGYVIKFVPKTDEQTIVTYQIFFALAFLIAVAEIVAFLRFKEKEKPVVRIKRPSVKEIAGVFGDKTYRKFLFLTLAFYFAWQLPWPVIGAYQVIELKADELWFANIALASGIGTYFGATFWGKKINKYGNGKILTISAFCMAVNIVIYVFAKGMWSLVAVNVYGGFVSAGITIALFNGLLEATPDTNRVVYIAVYNTLINLSLAVTPFIAYGLMKITSYQNIFVLDALLRALASVLILRGYWGKNPGARLKLFGRKHAVK